MKDNYRANATSSPVIHSNVKKLILNLYEIQAFKFGEFTLKSGIKSPIYVDLRVCVSHPEILAQVADALLQTASDVEYDLLCGVPYTALPFATAMSLKAQRPMVMRRKEIKTYGTKKIIEGEFTAGQTCLVVEDLVTSGSSVQETVTPLADCGLLVKDVVVLLDREQGARDNLKSKSIYLHSAFTLSTVLDLLVEAKKIESDVQKTVLKFIAENQISSKSASATAPEMTSITYEEKASKIKNMAGRRLLEIMITKKSNLAVSADVTTKSELFDLAEAVGPEICMLKTHADIITDWDRETGLALVEIAKRHNFLLFEDRKFADIGNTVLLQATGGVHSICKWADVINAHSVPGPGVIAGLEKASDTVSQESTKTMGLLLLAEMSCKGNLASGVPGYLEKTVELAEESKQFVFGFISMGKIASDEFLYITPGVSLTSGGDNLQQQYATPSKVIAEKLSDVIIVGRGIYKADDKLKAAKEYRLAGWRAYEQRCSGIH